MLIIRKKDLKNLEACAPGIVEFEALAGGKKLTIESKLDAVNKALAFMDVEDECEAEDRALYLEWLADEALGGEIYAKISKRTSKIMYGDNWTKSPSRKRCRRAARYVARKLWKYRKKVRKAFKEAAE